MILIPRRELDTDGGEYQGAEPVDDVKEVVHGQGALFLLYAECFERMSILFFLVDFYPLIQK